MAREALWEGMGSRGWSLVKGISAPLRAPRVLPTLPPREDIAEVCNSDEGLTGPHWHLILDF